MIVASFKGGFGGGRKVLVASFGAVGVWACPVVCGAAEALVFSTVDDGSAVIVDHEPLRVSIECLVFIVDFPGGSVCGGVGRLSTLFPRVWIIVVMEPAPVL